MNQQITYTGQTFSSLPKYLKKVYSDLFVYRFALMNFISMNLKSRYRRSALGALWTLLNPLLTMTTTVIAFSLVFRFDIKDFGIYVFSGMLPWNFISMSATMGTTSLVHGEGWLKKVYLPKAIFPFVAVNTELINHFLSLLSIFIIMLITRFPIKAPVLLLPVNILILFIFCLSIAIITGVFSVYFRDLMNIVQVVFQALFYLCPIIYPLEMMPQFAKDLMKWNPFYHYINLFRKVLYEGVLPSTVEFAIPLIISIVSFFLAFWVLMRKEKDLIFRL